MNRLCDSNGCIARCHAVHDHQGMETPTPIELGPVKLYQAGGKLLAHHKALAEPIEIDPKSLERWLMRQLRETVA